MPKSKITLTKIAKQAGVSITSVSRVINTPHLTSRLTQQRVNLAIAALGFDESLLKTYNQRDLQQKILIIDNQLITDSLINKGIESKAKAIGYKLLYLRFLYFSEQEIQYIISYTVHHNVDGILIINDSPYLALLQRYRHALPPILLINQFSLTLPCIYFDHLSNTYRATQYFTSQGHRRIAILLGDSNKTETHHIKQGYLQALTRQNIRVSTNYIVHDCVHYSASYRAVKKLMQSAFPPSAIICCDHLSLNYLDRDRLRQDEKFDETLTAESAICGVIDQGLALNIDIPADLSLLQFIHHKGHKQYGPLNHICSIYKPLFTMGEDAVTLLLALLDRNYRGLDRLIIEIEIINRSSTATVKATLHEEQSAN
ncbi:LacI family transcriptional regulator [Orbus hercynius]|uniref:LacI family transcriptional regulator n=1 Tax=Orbus hercynius TaxID=593135 RepID=A0A495RAL3_9GAMM|nr:LacI family DNA-binding transcriptional regulator [Orbus hercynius]RKS84533.1 LacI family transcriptional regulator [Orbus hercynius]